MQLDNCDLDYRYLLAPAVRVVDSNGCQCRANMSVRLEYIHRISVDKDIRIRLEHLCAMMCVCT